MRISKMTEHQGVRLTEATTEIRVAASREKVWEALLQYGDVASFHAGVAESVRGENSGDQASLGAERICTVFDGPLEITLVERITEFEPGSFYRYQVYDWKNFPLRVMFFAFGVREGADGATILTLVQNYRLKPGFLTGLMRWKIKQQQRKILLGYKHYIETGEKNVPIRSLARSEDYRLAWC